MGPPPSHWGIAPVDVRLKVIIAFVLGFALAFAGGLVFQCELASFLERMGLHQ
jgi:hypothetical protein